MSAVGIVNGKLLVIAAGSVPRGSLKELSDQARAALRGTGVRVIVVSADRVVDARGRVDLGPEATPADVERLREAVKAIEELLG